MEPVIIIEEVPSAAEIWGEAEVTVNCDTPAESIKKYITSLFLGLGADSAFNEEDELRVAEIMAYIQLNPSFQQGLFQLQNQWEQSKDLELSEQEVLNAYSKVFYDTCDAVEAD